MIFLNNLYKTLRRDRWVYYIYALIFSATSLVFIMEGLFAKARFTLYSAGFYALTIASIMMIAMGYFFFLLLQKNPSPIQAFTNQFQRFFKNPHELIALIIMLTATSFLLSVFTSIKTFIPHFQPFIYDQYYAELDRILHFGIDPWRISHSLFSGPWLSAIINVFYNLWFFIYWSTLLLFIIRVEPIKYRLQYLITHILCWIFIGGLLATLMSSAGPVYYHHFVSGPDLFADLMTKLNIQHIWLIENTDFMKLWALPTQDMIFQNSLSGNPSLGNGISAMPSMHVSIAVLIALGMKNIHANLSKLFWGFAIMIQIGSVHLGWHYAIDGYLAAIITVIVWKLVGKFLPEDSNNTQNKRIAS